MLKELRDEKILLSLREVSELAWIFRMKRRDSLHMKYQAVRIGS